MADTTVKLKADISNLKSQMQAAARQVKLANSEFKAAASGMDDWSSNAEGLRAKLKQLDTVLQSQKTRLSLLEDEYEKTKTLYGENSAAADKVKISINNMKAAINKTESEIKQYSQDLTDCEEGTGKFADATDDLDDSLEQAGDGFTVFKGIVSDLISNVIQWGIGELKEFASEVVEVGSSFEKSMSNVQALSGASAEELQLLSDTAKEFGANTQFSATEAADALSYMALAGWDAKTSTEALGGVLDLAASSGMDLASASDMVTDYLSAFGMQASESTYFADLLSYAQANANTTAEGLGEAFKNSAANMNAAGQDIETTTALLSSMANQGLKGSQAGTALSAVMRDITKKMEDGAIAIGETTVEVQDAQGNYRDLTDILKDVESATDGLGDAEKSSALLATFTADSIKGLNLILNAGVDEAASFEEELRNCGGAAAEAAKIMNDNLSGDLTALNSKIEGVKITIYESFAPAMREAVSEISDVIDSADWNQVGKDIGAFAVKAVNFAKDIISNWDGIKTIVQAVGTALGAAFVVSKVMTFASSIITLWKTFQTLKTVTEAATTSQLLLNAAQAATPIGLVTAAVAGLAAGLIYLASKTKEYTNDVEGLTSWEQNEIDKVYELKDSYQALKESRDEAVKDVQSEYAHYQTLAEELDSLVDKNGAVKEADQDRANFIITTLNEALGTEIEMVDGVIQNYKEEKDAIESLMETKRAQAILNANEEAYTAAIENQEDALKSYTTALGIYNQNKTELAEAEEKFAAAQKLTAEEWAEQQGLSVSSATAAEMYGEELQSLTNQINGSKEAIVQSKTAYLNAEKQYIEYQSTIKNYEGLSSAIISGDADKIQTALSQMVNDFITAETGTKEALEQQVVDMESNYESLKKAVESGSDIVTQEMVNEAAAMVDAAKEELDKLPEDASSAANAGASAYANTFGSESNKTLVKTKANEVRNSANKGIEPNGDEGTAGQNFVSGYIGGMEVKIPAANTTAENMGSSAVDALNKGQDSNSPSRATQTSGENFGQGFINGMNNKTSSIWTTAWNLAKTALNALKEGQKEGSPSKLTFQSGQYFTEGYINGVTSLQSNLVSAVKNLVGTAVKTASDVTGYDFVNTASGVATTLADSLANKTDYMIKKISYKNEKKVSEFDKQISKLESNRDKKNNKIQAASDKKIEKLNKKKSDTSDKKEKAKIEKQINAEKASAKKLIKANESKYTKLINTQNKYKEAYKNASNEFISEFSEAVNNYSSKAQELINSTMNGIADKYQANYDALISKQDELVSKLKSAGDLFEISGAGIMTISDIKEQTKQITDYTSALAQIKTKVSSELFDQIASYDMKEGKAFIDRLLQMSASDLDAYNKAYTEKMKAAEKAGETIYSQDIKKVGDEYQKELNKALADLPKQLEELGEQSMAGFVNGLTKNTDYMSKEVKTFINSMLETFKKNLKIKSPSRVMEVIGDYTGEGFILGLKDTINSVRDVASEMAKAAAVPLEDLQKDVNLSRAAVNTSGEGGAVGIGSSTVVNNYNLTQNNTSPKSLSALETYRARRQQIELVKALT
jgi:TP901 family phage tail tape measure protein